MSKETGLAVLACVIAMMIMGVAQAWEKPPKGQPQTTESRLTNHLLVAHAIMFVQFTMNVLLSATLIGWIK